MLLGGLCADPELRYTQGGQAVLHIRLATTESYFDKKEQKRVERTDFHNVVVWGKRGEALGKILGKGSSIFVEGSLRTSSYDDRDGNKRYKTEVIANNVILAGGKGAASEDGGAPRERSGRTAAREDRPARGAPPAEPPADDYSQGGYGGDDDIPF
jgi:single-strand DNA-binding protein